MAIINNDSYCFNLPSLKSHQISNNKSRNININQRKAFYDTLVELLITSPTALVSIKLPLMLLKRASFNGDKTDRNRQKQSAVYVQMRT